MHGFSESEINREDNKRKGLKETEEGDIVFIVFVLLDWLPIEAKWSQFILRSWRRINASISFISHLYGSERNDIHAI